jgi:selenium metabolism protein YedF
MLIDARGKACPGPVMMADDALSKMKEGLVEILVDNEEASLNLRGYAAQNGMAAEPSREGKDWKVRIVKGYVCDTGPGAGVRSMDTRVAKKTLLLIVGTDVLGKEEALGRMLIKGFFETMKVYKQLPHTIFFLNAGVRLTTTNGDVVPVLQEIEALGVEIFSCGTCLKHYGIEADLKVGRRGTTNHIVEGMQDFSKVVWV